MGRGVREVDLEIVVKPDDPHPDDVEQCGPIALDLGGLPFGGSGALEQSEHGLLHVDPVDVDRFGPGLVGRCQELADPAERPTADDREGDRDREHDRLDDDEGDHQRIHEASIA